MPNPGRLLDRGSCRYVGRALYHSGAATPTRFLRLKLLRIALEAGQVRTWEKRFRWQGEMAARTRSDPGVPRGSFPGTFQHSAMRAIGDGSRRSSQGPVAWLTVPEPEVVLAALQSAHG